MELSLDAGSAAIVDARSSLRGKPSPRHLRYYTKTAGAYFTPRGIVTWIVRTALREVTRKTLSPRSIGWNPAERAADLPLLRICDPAMGDGIFLEEAGLQLKTILGDYLKFQGRAFEVRGCLIPNPGEWVAANCLYGVDLDQSSVFEARRRIQDSLCPDASSDVTKKLEAHLVQGDALLDPLADRITADGADSRDVTRHSFRVDSGMFSWAIRFPEVFATEAPERRGFDIVVGNPPWEVIKVNDREFFDRLMPGFSKLPKDEREQTKTLLLRKPEVASEYHRYVRTVKNAAEALRHSQILSHQFDGREVYHGAWELNTFRLFIELGFYLTRRGGWYSLVVPSSFIGELSSVGLRRLLLDNAALKWVVAFHPAVKAFNTVDHPFCIFLAKRGGRTSRFRCIDGVTSVEGLDKRLQRAPFVDRSLLDSVAPDTATFISAGNETELQILRTLHLFPPLGHRVEGSWNARPARDIDETRDRHLLTTERTRYRFLKGKAVFPFLIRSNLLTHWVREDLYSKRDAHSQQSRIVWRDVTRPNMARRMYATIAPSRYAIGNSLNYIVPEQSNEEKRYLVAVMNSLVFEFQARKISKNSHMNMFVMRQIPVPRLRTGDPLFDEIVNETSAILNEESIPPRLRELTQGRIDALIAAAYALKPRELKYALSGYSRVAHEYKSLVLREFSKVISRGS